MTRSRALTTADGLAQLSFLVHGVLERCGGDASITLVRLMGVLRDRTPTMNELARLLDLDKSSVSGLVDRAERRGLVVREPSTADRRAIRVHLTDDGRMRVRDVAARFEAEVDDLLTAIPPARQAALTRLVSEVLVSHASRHGIDLFDTTDANGAARPS
jgi:DNA-binding MarR family transcriptional regulator